MALYSTQKLSTLKRPAREIKHSVVPHGFVRQSVQIHIHKHGGFVSLYFSAAKNAEVSIRRDTKYLVSVPGMWRRVGVGCQKEGNPN